MWILTQIPERNVFSKGVAVRAVRYDGEVQGTQMMPGADYTSPWRGPVNGH